ncbi:MAG TPA: hypothetical protein VN915_13135 [Elusimicrobiota bacterium]|nr:hypothetical protein [Elusimicrobiota bacterium]
MTDTMPSPIAHFSAPRRKQLAAALSRVLAPAQMTAARELMRAERPERREPQPEEILFWMRVNMPVATSRVERIIFSHE